MRVTQKILKLATSGEIKTIEPKNSALLANQKNLPKCLIFYICGSTDCED